MSEAIKKYKDIMRRYHDGEFGSSHLSLHQILTLADAQDLLDEITIEELQELMLETQNVSFKLAISQIRDMKG